MHRQQRRALLFSPYTGHECLLCLTETLHTDQHLADDHRPTTQEDIHGVY